MPISRQIQTPLCPMTAAVTDRGLCLLEMGSPERAARERSELESAFGQPIVPGEHALLDQLEQELGEYFHGVRTRFDIALDTPGSEWQKRVWDALIGVPFGQTVSYRELANRLGNPGGARAVGLANGSNRVSVVIPCHRVIAADGTLHGYGGGIPRKRWLLDHEAAHSGSGLFA